MNVVELTQALVRIPSENPIGTEAGMADFVVDWLSPLPNIEIDRHDVLPERPNVVGRLRGSGNESPVVLLAHMDTVPIGDNWSTEPFGAEIRDGRLYGRGSCDMKSGLAVALMAFANAARRGRVPSRDIIVGATMDEEGYHMRGVNELVKRGIVGRDAFVIATEPSDLRLAVAHKGLLWMELTITGKAAHAGNPQFGADAVASAAAFIHHFRQAISALPYAHPQLGRPAATFSKIAGGTKTNVVPDRVVMEIDIRLPPPMTLDEVKALLRASASAAEAAVPGTAISARQINNDRPPVEADGGHEFLAALDRAIQKITGVTDTRCVFPAYTDASVIQSLTGNPTSVVFGPGLLAQAHTIDEFVPVDQIQKSLAVLDEVIDVLCFA
jgi:succinyl-diaminopimelate desuccinylase